MKWPLPVLAFVIAASTLASADGFAQAEKGQGGPPPPPPVRAIPGLTAEDPHPRACVDCHVVMKDFNMDVRISTLMDKWTQGVEPKLLAAAKAAAPDSAKIKGKHPGAKAALKNIPGGCLACHGKSSKTAPPFARLMHAIHLVGGDQNLFMGYYQGDCTHCHKLDAQTGNWSVPSAAEPSATP